MLRYRIFVVLSLAIFLFGYCRVFASNAENRPDWTKKTAQKIDYGDSYAFVGFSSAKKTEKEALDSAELDAFVHIGRLFGVTVGGSLEDIRVQSGKNSKSKYSYKITDKNYILGQPITIKDSNIADYFTEEPNKGRWNAWVLVEIPKTEYERIKKEIEAEELKRLQMTDEEKAYEVAKNAITQRAKTAAERDEVAKVLQNYLADYEDENPKHTEQVKKRLDELGYEPVKKAMMNDSKALRYSGISLTVIGAAVAIGGITGFCIEFERHYDKYKGMLNKSSVDNAIINKEDKPSYLNRAEGYREKSNLYKKLAITSGVVGGAIAITGITLTALGVQKRNKYMNKRKDKNVFLIPTDRGFYASLSLNF